MGPRGEPLPPHLVVLLLPSCVSVLPSPHVRTVYHLRNSLILYTISTLYESITYFLVKIDQRASFCFMVSMASSVSAASFTGVLTSFAGLYDSR